MAQLSPVSFAQQRLWFLDQLEPGTCVYNLPTAIRIRGVLNVRAFAQALAAIVCRHDSLHTTFTSVEGQVMACIRPDPDPVALPVVDLGHMPEQDKEEHALRIAAEEGQRPFDLSAGPLLRVLLLRFSSEHHLLVLTMHHIITDGWSIGILLKELAKFYVAYDSNQPLEVARLPMGYSDFARWQREALTGDVQARQLEHWQRTLSGAPSVLELPADRLRPAVQSHKGDRYTVRLDAELTRALAELGTKERVTPFMMLLAAFETLLWRYTGVPDFVLGTPMAGRSHCEFEPLIGLFVNTVPLRANLGGDPTFQELLRRVRDTALDAFSHQDVPFEKLVEALQPERSTSHTPLFQTMFILHNNPRSSLQFAGLRLEELELYFGLAKFDLTLECYEENGYCCTWEYSTDLFDRPRIVRMAQHFEALLQGICSDPGRRLSELPILPAAERNRILVEWNATAAGYPDNICIHSAFEARAAKYGDAIAIRAAERHVTYRQLNEEANCLSDYLRRQGVEPQDRVGVAAERSADAVVAMLAVMKAGASYVPIDPAYPKQRIEFMLRDSGAKVLIAQYGLRVRLPEHAGRIIFIDRDRDEIRAESRLDSRVPFDCHNPAYVIYTSGSTGNPKGVLGTHRASMNRFAWMWKAYPFGSSELCAQKTSLSFVDSICEIFGPLLQGVPILVIPDETVMDAGEFVRQIAAYRVTRMTVVPSQLAAILEACADLEIRLPDLRLCFTSGEALPYALHERFAGLLPHAVLVNLYGSSEVAADVTCFDTARTPPRGIVPIGKPISNVCMFVLDEYLNPVPIGVPGVIYAGGDCLALGYLNRPELTAQRFIHNPFSPGERLYKTGDLGRYDQDGNIEFLGRADNQVKIRGIRIELGEIEATLKAHESLREAAVVARNDGADQRLVAYLVPAAGQDLDLSGLRRYLKAQLPGYMTPSAFVILDSLPMTPNGKLDQRALPAPEVSGSQIEGSRVAPRNEIEVTLVGIWAELLRIDGIGVFDNFFELGGHSLLATQVSARIRKYMGVEVPVRSLFEEPTVAALARIVEQSRAAGATVNLPIPAAWSKQQSRAELEKRLLDLSDEEVDMLLNTALARRRKATGAAG
ncbi:MAG TPA: amino acid adenylation domain-containing protein [Bryobacteraceae bacterium]